MKIVSKDISVVIQGKNIKKQTQKCCKSIRKYLPEATIIFSTYDNEDTKDLDVDKIVYSKDPGATLLSGKMYNNINRILVTTKSGLKEVETKYCIKMRSDMIFANAKILENIFEKFPLRDKNFAVFKQRIVFYSLWSRKYEYMQEYCITTPFHLSDWFCFGLTEDIKNFFAKSPLTKEPDYTEYFKNPANRMPGFYIPGAWWKFSPEQYFALNFFQDYFPEAKMKNFQDFSDNKAKLSAQVLASNVIIAGFKELGVYIQKRRYCKISKQLSLLSEQKQGVWSYADFICDYKHFCDPHFVLPLRYFWPVIFDVEETLKHLKKHTKAFVRPFKEFLHWLSHLFSIISYSTQFARQVIKNLLIKKGA